MRIHFFINGPFPYGMAAAKRRLCYAKGLIAAGNKVEVHIYNRCFNIGDNDGFKEKGIYNNIPYNYIAGKYKRKNKILRGIDWYLIDNIKSFAYALRIVEKNDIIYCYFYPVLLQILLLIVSKIKKAKIVKETCEHPSALGKNTIWNKCCRWFEYRFVMPHYDGFIPISCELENFVNKYKKKNAKSIIIPILVDDDLYNIDFSKYSSPYNVPYIIHTGTMLEQKDSISKIITAFAKYKKKYNSNLKLVFTGPHANKKCNYIPLMSKLGVKDDIELLGLVSVEEIAILQHFATMTIIYKSDNIQTRNCFPTKLGEMLISGVPVITTTIGDANLYLKNEDSALIINPDDEDKLIEYINLLASDKNLAKTIGQNGKQIAMKYFNPIYQGKNISEFFNKLF